MNSKKLTGVAILAVCVVLVFTSCSLVTQTSEVSNGFWEVDREGIFKIAVKNPQPDVLPSLVVTRPKAHDFCVWIAMSFPENPGLMCDAWSFEGGMATFLSARELDGGGLELRHSMDKHPGVVHVMILTPEKGAVTFEGRLELGKTESDKENTKDLADDFLNEMQVPNICYQVIRSPKFQSAPANTPRCSPDPKVAKNYWDNYVSRSFIFTDEGMTFLSDTKRTDTSKDHNFPEDDPRNLPPAVQRYYGVWQSVPKGQGTSSLTRYTLPAIGAVSSDKNNLIAGASGNLNCISQAWLDCFHLYAKWAPTDKPSLERTWKIKIYGMENDADALTKCISADFPGIDQLKDTRAPLHK